jgi:hypothetical protein
VAADFDKRSWTDDVLAFAETCRAIGVPAAVERSRSGQGAHAWFFFAAPVPAVAARKMASYLLTETMSRRHQLGMESYDRLFPNQDTLPRGGFGSLIALPLQHEPRQAGNTVFVDDRFVPYPDQWAFLAGAPRVHPDTVERLARDATRAGQVLGVRWTDADAEDDDASPWARPPSRRELSTRLPGPIPRAIRSVLGQRLFVEKAGLDSPQLNQIKRLAAFQNPEFYKKQRLRLSTHLTPRVIACAEELAEYVALPRGCRDDLEALLGSAGSTLAVEDRRQPGEPLDLRFQGELTPVQEQAAQALLSHDAGVFVAPPGVGKTVVGTYLVAARGRSTLVLVHRQPLLDQWVAQLGMFLGRDPKAIGQIGAGKRKPTGRLDVAMLQSPSSRLQSSPSGGQYHATPTRRRIPPHAPRSRSHTRRPQSVHWSSWKQPGRSEQPAEGQADPLALKPGLGRHAMHVVTLARSTHDEKAPVAQIHVMSLSHAPSARPNGEPAGRAKRHNRDHRVFAELRFVVSVKPHAIIATPVAVGQDMVEGHTSLLADASQESAGGPCEGSRLQRLPRVPIPHVAGPGDQARLKDPPPKQNDFTLLPGQLVAECRQHGIRLLGRKPHRLMVEPGAECERDAHVDERSFGY